MTEQIMTSEFESTRANLIRLRDTLEETIVGQEQLITELMIGIFSPGHVLLEGPPGLGKTNLAKALAAALGVKLSRIQCTPDLMPADITGSEAIGSDDKSLRFRPGPLFAPLVLVDEINRATPRTQAAFLEAMQERQVTHMGHAHALPEPFWVIATQNPIELEGTYPLPEAQLDRFLLKVKVPYPSSDALLSIARIALDDEPADHVECLLSREEIDRISSLTRQIAIARPLVQAAVDIVIATHPDRTEAHPLAKAHVRYGVSPRGLQALLRAARVHALLENRAHVAVDDLRRVTLPALRHRILLRFESEVDGITSDGLLTSIAGQVLDTK